MIFCGVEAYFPNLQKKKKRNRKAKKREVVNQTFKETHLQKPVSTLSGDAVDFIQLVVNTIVTQEILYAYMVGARKKRCLGGRLPLMQEN